VIENVGFVMSQVIITKDKFSSKRKDSALEEKAIDREGLLTKWKRDDITGFDPIAAAAGIAAAPVAAIFYVFSVVAKLAIFLTASMSLVISKIIGLFR
jgi:hypothetical protein